MKILAIHNYHRKGSASGDDIVFRNETDLLETKGNIVIRYTISNDVFDNSSIFKKIINMFGIFWSFKHYNAIKKIIRSKRPDIVHIHTFFPLLSPSVLYAAKRLGCKVVVTLHDTRFICPCATSLREKQICNVCGDGKYYRMCKYHCFKGSRVQSFIVACVFTYHRIRKSFYKQIDCYICLNDQQINLLKHYGFDSKKIVKKYNFVLDKNIQIDHQKILPERYVVFYGRIGEEKGIHVLKKIWENLSQIPLVVMGSGPLEEELTEWAKWHNQVYFLGYVQHEECLSIVKESEFVVFPSIWYEGCSMVEIETENIGKALVATDLGFSSEAIENGVNGYKVSPGDIDGFVSIIKRLWNNPDECIRMGKNARSDYETKYMPTHNYTQLIEIYHKTLEIN